MMRRIVIEDEDCVYEFVLTAPSVVDTFISRVVDEQRSIKRVVLSQTKDLNLR